MPMQGSSVEQTVVTTRAYSIRNTFIQTSHYGPEAHAALPTGTLWEEVNALQPRRCPCLSRRPGLADLDLEPRISAVPPDRLHWEV